MMNRVHRLVWLVGSLVITLNSNEGLTQSPFWQQTSGPSGGSVAALAINAKGTIFAGTLHGGVFRSVDYGDTWTPVNTGMTTLDTRALAISSRGIIFAGGGDVYRSMDDGETWIPVLTGRGTVQALAISAGGIIFTGTNNHLFRSVDDGETWTPANTGLPTAIDVRVLTISAMGAVFAGLFKNGLFRSVDNGKTWTRLDVNAGLFNAMAVSSNGTIFVSGHGLFRSVDNGKIWIHLDTGFDVQALAGDTRGIVFAGSFGDGVFRSEDNGETWTPINTGLTGLDAQALAINAKGTIFAGTRRSGVFRSVQPIFTGISQETEINELPTSLSLAQNYPNPFNPETTITYDLPDIADVRLIIYDLSGQAIRALVHGYQQPGRYMVMWDGQDGAGREVASGVYLYRLEAVDRGFVQTKRMVFLQ